MSKRIDSILATIDTGLSGNTPCFYGFYPEETVRVRGTNTTGTVTYPGMNGHPERVFVRLYLSNGGRHTAHYHYSELERVS